MAITYRYSMEKMTVERAMWLYCKFGICVKSLTKGNITLVDEDYQETISRSDGT